MYNLKIISSTVRPGRKGPVVANWIKEVAANHGSFNVELLDLGGNKTSDDGRAQSSET